MVLDGRSTGGAENSIHKESICLDLKERHGGAVSLVVCGNTTQVNEGSMQTPGITAGKFSCTSNGNIHVRAGKKQNDVTLEDIYNKQYSDDDEDDSDWEPLQKSIHVLKWFCVNCTMVNLDNVHHCDVCGEHRESGILKLGYLASPLLPEGVANENGSRASLETKEAHYQNVASSNSTMVGFDERMLLHNEIAMKSHPHPERPDRLRAIAAGFATAGIFPGRCASIPAREITREELQRVHSSENIEAVELTSQMVASYFSPDTYANEHSALAARLAAGACADLASAIFTGRAKNGFALVRPPGHHAGVKQSSGFCLHNNAAVAASAAQLAGAKKVLIVDWDVHHGNGTQEIFDRSKSVLYVSLHRHEDGKFYPGTGAADNVGSMGAEGFCVNIPWSRRGVGDNDYIYAFQQVVIPIATEFAPDFTIISAGFDAARGDPLGCCDVTPDGFAQMMKMLSVFSGGKLLVILEGGYNLRSISSSATAVIKVLLGEEPVCSSDKVFPSRSGLQTICAVLKIQMKFWHILEPIFSKLQSQWGDAFVGTVTMWANDSSAGTSRKETADRIKKRVNPKIRPEGRAPDAQAPEASSQGAGRTREATSQGVSQTREAASLGVGQTQTPPSARVAAKRSLLPEEESSKRQRADKTPLGGPLMGGPGPLHVQSSAPATGAEAERIPFYMLREREPRAPETWLPDWSIRTNESVADTVVAWEWNRQATLPVDRLLCRRLSDTDAEHETYRAIAITQALVSDQIERKRQLHVDMRKQVLDAENHRKRAEASEREMNIMQSRMEQAENRQRNAEKKLKEAEGKLKKADEAVGKLKEAEEKLKRTEEKRKQAEEKLKANDEELHKLQADNAARINLFDSELRYAKNRGVRKYLNSRSFRKDIEVLLGIAYWGGVGENRKLIQAKFPDISLEGIPHHPEIADRFPFLLAELRKEETLGRFWASQGDQSPEADTDEIHLDYVPGSGPLHDFDGEDEGDDLVDLELTPEDNATEVPGDAPGAAGDGAPATGQ